MTTQATQSKQATRLWEDRFALWEDIKMLVVPS
jgi:hypothetical protein